MRKLFIFFALLFSFATSFAQHLPIVENGQGVNTFWDYFYSRYAFKLPVGDTVIRTAAFDSVGLMVFKKSDRKVYIRDTAASAHLWTSFLMSSSSAGGDVSGTFSNLSVNKILGATIATPSTGNLRYNGSSFVFDGTTYYKASDTTSNLATQNYISRQAFLNAFTSGGLSPLFGTSVATASGTASQTFSLTSTSEYTLFGRASGSGSPSYLSSIDSNWIPSLHSQAYYDARYSVGSTGATGDMISFSSTNTTSNISAVASGSVFASNGTSTKPVWTSSPSISTSVTSPIFYGSASSLGNMMLKSNSTGTTGKILFDTYGWIDSVGRWINESPTELDSASFKQYAAMFTERRINNLVSNITINRSNGASARVSSFIFGPYTNATATDNNYVGFQYTNDNYAVGGSGTVNGNDTTNGSSIVPPGTGSFSTGGGVKRLLLYNDDGASYITNVIHWGVNNLQGWAHPAIYISPYSVNSITQPYAYATHVSIRDTVQHHAYLSIYGDSIAAPLFLKPQTQVLQADWETGIMFYNANSYPYQGRNFNAIVEGNLQLVTGQVTVGGGGAIPYDSLDANGKRFASGDSTKLKYDYTNNRIVLTNSSTTGIPEMIVHSSGTDYIANGYVNSGATFAGFIRASGGFTYVQAKTYAMMIDGGLGSRFNLGLGVSGAIGNTPTSNQFSFLGNGRFLLNDTTDRATGIIQSTSTSQAQLALHYSSTVYATFTTNSAGSLGLGHLTGITLPTSAIPNGSSSDSLVAMRTSASGIDTLVKIAQPSNGLGATYFGDITSTNYSVSTANGMQQDILYEPTTSGTITLPTGTSANGLVIRLSNQATTGGVGASATFANNIYSNSVSFVTTIASGHWMQLHYDNASSKWYVMAEN